MKECKWAGDSRVRVVFAVVVLWAFLGAFGAAASAQAESEVATEAGYLAQRELFFSGQVISGPDLCSIQSLGGPTTFPLDSDGDGVADVCSLPATRREVIARQRAMDELAWEFPSVFSWLFADYCANGVQSFGQPQAEAVDECSTGLASKQVWLVPLAAPSVFYSGPVISGPEYCLNASLGGQVAYPSDSGGDGVADTCSESISLRSAVARQKSLEALALWQSDRFRALIAEACANGPRSMGETKAETTDECSRKITGTPDPPTLGLFSLIGPFIYETGRVDWRITFLTNTPADVGDSPIIDYQCVIYHFETQESVRIDDCKPDSDRDVDFPNYDGTLVFRVPVKGYNVLGLRALNDQGWGPWNAISFNLFDKPL